MQRPRPPPLQAPPGTTSHLPGQHYQQWMLSMFISNICSTPWGSREHLLSQPPSFTGNFISRGIARTPTLLFTTHQACILLRQIDGWGR